MVYGSNSFYESCVEEKKKWYNLRVFQLCVNLQTLTITPLYEMKLILSKKKNPNFRNYLLCCYYDLKNTKTWDHNYAGDGFSIEKGVTSVNFGN